MAFTLPPLPYPTDTLVPHIDKLTMEIHHGKHHNAYVTNLNKALESAPDLANKSLEELLAKIAPLCRKPFAPPSAITAADTATTHCSGRSFHQTEAGRLLVNCLRGNRQHVWQLRRIQNEIQ